MVAVQLASPMPLYFDVALMLLIVKVPPLHSITLPPLVLVLESVPGLAELSVSVRFALVATMTVPLREML